MAAFSFLSKFEQPRVLRIAIALAVALLAPSLVSGLALDDYKLVAQLSQRDREAWPGSAPFDLFRWMDPEHNHRFMDGLGFPWWTEADAKVAFMRPLTSLTHTLDQWLWPQDAFWMHAQSLAWFALLLLLAARTYAALIETRWVAGVAGALFAFDHAHGVPAGWLCNRNALVAGAFALGALLLHHRARTGGTRMIAAAAWLCFGLGLLAGELGIGVAGYLFAYALLYEQGPRTARVRSLVPYALIAIAWGVLRSAGGYGAHGVDFYLDPIGEPLAFLSALPSRWAQLLSSQASGLPSDVWGMVEPGQRPALIAFVLAVAAALVWFVSPSLRRDRASRFWALGAALSAVPVTAALPSDRLLVLVGVGVMPVLAQAMYDAFERVRAQALASVQIGTGATRLRGASAAALALVHLGVAPLMLPISALSPALLDRAVLDVDRSLPKDASVRGQTVIVADVPDPLVLSYLPLRREFLNEVRPAQLYWLSAARAALRLTRRAPNVLRVSARRGLFSRETESGARSVRSPFKRGDRVVLSQMTVEVIALSADGRPTVCDFTFAQPLESRSYLWKTWRGGQLVNFRVPALGETIETRPDQTL